MSDRDGLWMASSIPPMEKGVWIDKGLGSNYKCRGEKEMMEGSHHSRNA